MQTAKRNFRLAIGLIAAGMLLAVSVLVWQIWSSQRDERAFALQQTEQRAGQLATAVAEHIAVFTRGIDFVLLELREEYAGGNNARFRSDVALLLKSFSAGAIVQLSIADANGNMAYSNLGLAKAVSIRDREHFVAHLDGGDRLYISKPVFGRVSGKWSIQFTRPVLRDGRFAGIIVASVAPAYFGKVLSLSKEQPTDNAALLNGDGAFLAHDSMLDQVMGKSVPPSRPFLAPNAPPRGVFRAQADTDSIERIGGWVRVPGTRLITTVGFDPGAMLGLQQRRFAQRWINAAVFALAFLVLGIVTLRLVSRLGRRQRALAASEARFRDLTELSTHWYWEQDAGLRFSLISEGWHTKCGLGLVSVLGKLRWELPIASVSEEQWQAHRTLLARREPFRDFAYESVDENGDRRWTSVSGKPIFAETGQFLGYRGTGHDITERKRAELEASRAHALLQEAIDSIASGFSIYDENDRLLFCNQAYRDLYSTSRDLIVPGTTFEEIVRKGAERGQYKEAIGRVDEWVEERVRLHRQAGDVQVEQRLDDGRWLLVVEHRTPSGFIVGNRIDISERKQVEQALRENEAQLREAQHMAHIGSWQLDMVENKLTWSDEVFRIFEIAPERFSASYEAFLAIAHPADRAAIDAAYTQSVREHKPYAITHRLLMADGRIKYVHEQCETIYDEHGQPLQSRGTVQDISEQKRVEGELRVYAQRLRKVSRHLAQTQETERRQVAEELHDSMGRDLTALAIDLALIRGQLPAQVLADVAPRLDDAQALITSAMHNVKTIVTGLRPAMLDEWGLLPALRWHAAECSKRAAIPVEVAITGEAARLPKEAELALFRVAQEALFNCAKHACAKRIDVGLEMIPGRTTLTITDDGVGFIVEDLDSDRRPAGLGLALMHERMEAVGGRLRMASSPGRGTRISAQIEE